MTRISGVNRNLAGRVGSGQEIFKSRGSGQVVFKSHGSGRVGSGGFQNLAHQVGLADPTRPDPTREV